MPWCSSARSMDWPLRLCARPNVARTRRPRAPDRAECCKLAYPCLFLRTIRLPRGCCYGMSSSRRSPLKLRRLYRLQPTRAKRSTTHSARAAGMELVPARGSQRSVRPAVGRSASPTQEQTMSAWRAMSLAMFVWTTSPWPRCLLSSLRRLSSARLRPTVSKSSPLQGKG